MGINDGFRRASSLIFEIDRLRAQIEADYTPRLQHAATPMIRRRIERKMRLEVAKACAPLTEELRTIALSAHQATRLHQACVGGSGRPGAED